jgi:hypothetical protein
MNIIAIPFQPRQHLYVTKPPFARGFVTQYREELRRQFGSRRVLKEPKERKPEIKQRDRGHSLDTPASRVGALAKLLADKGLAHISVFAFS